MIHSSADPTVPKMSEPSSPSGPRYHLGVLLVHGMGEQPEGDTLLAFGEPIVRWMRRWFASSPAGSDQPTIEEISAALHPARELRAEPAHAELSVRARNDCGQLVEQRWLMAESWWGGDVQRPAFGKLTFWMLTVGAWVVFSHFGKHRRFGTIGGDAKAILVSLVVSLPIVLAFQAFVLAVSILAVLPIPQVRKSLSTLLLTMTGVLGDAFVLLENPLQRAAIVERARRSLRWLADDCTAVIVLAHSQGAAVAHDVLRHATPENVKALLTFGSGLQKLKQIEAARNQGYAGTMAVAAPLTAGLLALLILAFIGFRDNAPAWLDLDLFWLGRLVIAMFALMVFLALYMTMRTYWMQDANKQAAVLLSAPLWPFIKSKSWVDVFATCDPVPNGSLYREGSVLSPESEEIVNRRDLLADHTTYWDNNAEFLPLVADMLGRVAGLRIIEPVDRSAMQAAVARYRWCVRCLQINRWAVGAALVAAAALFARQLASWGEATTVALKKLPIGVEPLATGLVGAVNGVAGWVGPRLGFGPIDRAGETALGFVLPLLVIVLLKMAFAPVWQLWARETVWQALEAQRATPTPASTASPTAAGDARVADEAERAGAGPLDRKLPLRFLTDAAVISLGVAPLVLILAWRFSDAAQALTGLLRGAGALVLLAMLFTMIGMVEVLKQPFRALRASRGRGLQDWIKIAVGLTMLSVLLSFLLRFIPGVPEGMQLAPLLAMEGLLLLVLALVAWSNLLGRFASAAWKVSAVGVPLLIGAAGLLAALPSLKRSEWFGLVGGPIFGVFVGLGLIWLIATIAGRRVPGAQRSDVSSPVSSAPAGPEAPARRKHP